MFQQQGTFLGDFFHVSEYLGAAAVTCRHHQPDRWRQTQQQRLRRGAVPQVIAALEPHLECADTADEEAPVRKGCRYLNNRLDGLDYPRALALGLPIGSGMIESGHRHVLQARLKQAGTTWLPDHTDQIAHLRVLTSMLEHSKKRTTAQAAVVAAAPAAAQPAAATVQAAPIYVPPANAYVALAPVVVQASPVYVYSQPAYSYYDYYPYSYSYYGYRGYSYPYYGGCGGYGYPAVSLSIGFGGGSRSGGGHRGGRR